MNHRLLVCALFTLSIILHGCATSEQMATTGSLAPEEQVDAVQRASRTENPSHALETLEGTGGKAGPVLLTLTGALRAEQAKYEQAASHFALALRLVKRGKQLAAQADLPRHRPLPGNQKSAGRLPAVDAERTLLETLRRAIHGEASNEDILRILADRSAAVRYPPLYEGGAGLVLEVLRQHLGDNAFRIVLLPYASPRSSDGGQNAEKKARRLMAAQNLLIAGILSRNSSHVKTAHRALKEVAGGDASPELRSAEDILSERRSNFYLALASYLLGKPIHDQMLAYKARKLLK